MITRRSCAAQREHEDPGERARVLAVRVQRVVQRAHRRPRCGACGRAARSGRSQRRARTEKSTARLSAPTPGRRRARSASTVRAAEARRRPRRLRQRRAAPARPSPRILSTTTEETASARAPVRRERSIALTASPPTAVGSTWPSSSETSVVSSSQPKPGSRRPRATSSTRQRSVITSTATQVDREREQEPGSRQRGGRVGELARARLPQHGDDQQRPTERSGSRCAARAASRSSSWYARRARRAARR